MERRTKMAYQVKTKNRTYTLKDGFVLKDELNETLDSGVISFNVYGGEINAEPFDYAELSDNNTRLVEDKMLLIDEINPEIYVYGPTYNSCDYTYNVTLFSQTKELERIVLPNCSVTQPINGNNKKTVMDELNRFLNLYGTKIRIKKGNSFEFGNKYYFSQAVEDMFASVECPEFQWNRPTLREVFNDLMSVKDCIVNVKNNEIGLINLRAHGNQIDTTKLLYSKPVMTSADYVGELSIDLQNGINNQTTRCCEYMTLKAPDGEATVTTDNAIFRTQKPIYKMLGITAYVKIKQGNYYIWNQVNISNFIKEYEEWNLLSACRIDVLNPTWNSLESVIIDGRTVKFHKSNFLYFKRGNNTIENFLKRWDAIGTDKYFVEQIILNGITISGDVREILYVVQYETLAAYSVNCGRYLKNSHPENRIIDSQTNSYVDIEHQSVFEYAKANRLGNKIREIGGNYSKDSQVPELGDRIDDEILFSRELCYWDGMVQFKGYLAPNYVLKDFFTGVNAKRRSWQIAKNEDALTRHDILKLYYEASFKIKNEDFTLNGKPGMIKSLTMIGNESITSLFTSCFTTYQDKRITNAVVETSINDEYYPGETDGFVMDCNVAITGMSLCFSFGFNDNYKAADYMYKEDDGEFRQAFYQYANGDGEYENFEIYLVRNPDGIGDGEHSLPMQIGIGATEANEIVDFCLQKPKAPITGASYSHGERFAININGITFKDNREIIKNTVQFELCSDTKKIIITNLLFKLSSVYNASIYTYTPNFRIHYSTTHEYIIGDTVDDETSYFSGSGNISVAHISNNTSRVSISGSIISSLTLKSWAITDENNNILIAVNGNTRDVYLNLLRSRDTNIYGSDGMTVVGTIEE